MMSTVSIAEPKQHVSSTPGVCGGKPCIIGTRIRVWDIVCMSDAGNPPERIVQAYPHITIADVHAALAYYFDHREEIEAQMREADQWVEAYFQQAGPGPIERKLAKFNEAPVSDLPGSPQ